MYTQDNFATISDNNNTTQIHQQFAALLNKILSALNQQLFDQFNQYILEKCRQSSDKNYKTLAQIIETLVNKLVKRIQSQQFLIAMDITKADYQILEESLQKAEAEIRNMFKIQHQQNIYQDNIQEKLREREIKLQQANKTILSLKNSIEKYQKQRKEMSKKLDIYQQKYSSAHRENRWESAQKSTQNLLLHKASLHFKDKNKLQPYLQNISKSKHILVRRKQTSKLLKEKASKILCFESLKDKHQSNQPDFSLKHNSSISFQGKKLRAGNSLSQLNSSIPIRDPTKKKKNRVLRNVTQITEK